MYSSSDYNFLYSVTFSISIQVLSNSVSKALVLTYNPDVSETARFMEMMDKLFDCLNVTNFTAGKHARKVFQDPWRPNDFRFKVSS